jgi:hypothetical protein
MDLCTYESEEDEQGVGTGVNTTLLSDTLWSIGLTEFATEGLVQKKTMDLKDWILTLWPVLLFRLRTNCSDKTNKQIGNVFVAQFVLISVLLFCVVKW